VPSDWSRPQVFVPYHAIGRNRADLTQESADIQALKGLFETELFKDVTYTEMIRVRDYRDCEKSGDQSMLAEGKQAESRRAQVESIVSRVPTSSVTDQLLS